MKNFTKLMALTEGEDTPFYFVDKEKEGRNFRIFLYRLASWTDFERECALLSRGVMYDITDDVPVLSCVPPLKFFNAHENINNSDDDKLFILAKNAYENNELSENLYKDLCNSRKKKT